MQFLIEQKLNTKVTVNGTNGYKWNDYKPFYGKLFEDNLLDCKFWYAMIVRRSTTH